MGKNSMRVKDSDSKGFGETKDASEAFDKKEALTHFEKTGQASDELFSPSGFAKRDNAPEPTPDK